MVRACLEALAFQVADLVAAMEDDCGQHLETLAVDGGACKNNFLMQFQADILDSKIERPANVEATALGAAYLAGLFCGFWEDIEQIRQLHAIEAEFSPTMETARRRELLAGWADCVSRTKSN